MTTVTPGTGLLSLDGYAPVMPVRPGTGVLSLWGVPAQAGTLYHYATIEAGIVTAINRYSLTLPTSTLTTLYYDITNYSPTPNVGDYFDEVCQVFSTAPLTVPPGSIAPPFPPGGTPVPPGSGITPIAPPPPTPPVLVPVPIPFHANPKGTTLVTNMPAARTELATGGRTRFDLTRCYGIRAQGRVVVNGPAGSVVAFEYSPNCGGSWLPLDGVNGPWMLVENIGDRFGPLVGIDPYARHYVLIRAVTDLGDGISDLELANFGLIAYISVDNPPVFISTVAAAIPTGCGVATAWPQYIDFVCAPPLPTVTPLDFDQYIERWGKYSASVGPENQVIFLSSGWFYGQADYTRTSAVSTTTDTIDTVELWHGHRTYKGYPYFDTFPSDGGIPAVTENLAGVDLTDFWGRMRVKFDQGFSTSATASPVSELLLYEFHTSNEYAAFGFDTYRDELRIWGNWDGVLANAQVVGTATGHVLTGDWIEVGFHWTEAGGTFTIDFYIGTPCTALAPIGRVTGNGKLGAGSFDSIGHFQYYTNSNPTHFWLGDIEEYIPEATYPNPFGYS